MNSNTKAPAMAVVHLPQFEPPKRLSCGCRLGSRFCSALLRFATRCARDTRQAVLATSLPSAACAAASRAIGMRNGEQDT
jgi:hypothetical protein